jgi:hypothetical protein
MCRASATISGEGNDPTIIKIALKFVSGLIGEAAANAAAAK